MGIGGGADVAQQYLKAGLLDELELRWRPCSSGSHLRYGVPK